jgi:transposase
MKINRSSKIHFTKWLTASKQNQLDNFLREYARIVNLLIIGYEEIIPEIKKTELLYATHIQSMMANSGTWLSARCVKNAFAEGYGMVQSAKSNAKSRKTKYYRPVHYGKKAILSETNNTQSSTKISEFDFMVTLGSIGNKLKIHIPLKKHKQFNMWNDQGKRSKSITLTRKYIMFSFEIETGEKKEPNGKYVGVDIGMNILAATSMGDFFGSDLRTKLEQLTNKKQCSAGYYRKKAEIKEYINHQLKQIPYSELTLVVVEKLKNLKLKTKLKRRLSGNIRRVISNWCYRHVLDRIQMLCEENRVSFRSVPANYTSQDCSSCGHRDKKNRLSQSEFVCQSCGHIDNADTNASKNILDRFITGPYGAGYKLNNAF